MAPGPGRYVTVIAITPTRRPVGLCLRRDIAAHS